MRACLRGRRVRTGLFVLLAAMLVAGPSAADDGVYPGLPKMSVPGIWGSAAGTGMTHVTRARQGVRIPYQLLAFHAQAAYAPTEPMPGANVNILPVVAYWVSPAGARDNYGVAEPLKVRTMAFGAIPVELTVVAEQARTAAGLPEPLRTENRFVTYDAPQPGAPGNARDHNEDATGHGRVWLRIASLRVDGIAVELTGRCRTATPAVLSVVGKGYWFDEVGVDTKVPWESGRYAAGNGGLLTGSLTVPDFTSCTTATGDDLSPLVSATASGTTEVAFHLSGNVCDYLLPPYFLPNQFGPAPPGATLSAPHCATQGSALVPPEIDYP